MAHTSAATLDDPRALEAMRQAVREADAAAGRDDAAFVRAVHERFHRRMEQVEPARALRVAPAAANGPRSFHIYEDRRYLKNARKLARRTLGGDRIIGGTTVGAGQFLDCVAVGSEAQWACTGTLIAPSVVLTAGHCASVATRVYLGSDVTRPGLVVRVKKRVRHPKYHVGKHNDLLVLILEQAVQGVAPRALAAKAKIDKADDGRAVGFGATDASGTFGYGVKRQVDVPVASSDCRGKAGGHDDHTAYGCDAGLEVVAGRPLLAQDSCNGDSGGPFYILDGKAWKLAGVTSRATDSAVHNCGDGGIYVRVDRYRAWIDGIPGVTLPS